jgi:putative zinc finger/helix-turn-helix YgiT family protein
MDSTKLPVFSTEELGIPLLIINSVTEERCTECGEVSHSFPHPEKLNAAAAVCRATMPDKLTGREIRFLRKALAMSAKDVAESLSVTPETMSRWENDKAPMTPQHEKLLRLLVGLGLREQAPLIAFDADVIVRMNIRGIRHPGRKDVLAFELVRYRASTDKPSSEEYSGEQKAA